MDKNNSHKTMVQKEERHGYVQFTQNNDTKRREGDKNNHKTMTQKEERHG